MTDLSAPAASLGRWNEISAPGAGLLTVLHAEHPGDCGSEGYFNV